MKEEKIPKDLPEKKNYNYYVESLYRMNAILTIALAIEEQEEKLKSTEQGD